MQYSSNIIFTFWKKYNIGYNNEINNLIINTNYNFYTEWLANFNFFLNKYINNINIKNNILDNFYNLYTLTNFNLTNDYLNLSFSNPKILFIKLKVIFDRFYNSNNQIYFPNFQINFNDYFKIYFYNNDINNINYNLDNFKNLILNQTNNYNLLNSSFDTILPDESKNIVPVDLQNIFYLIAYDLIESLYNNTQLCNYPQIFSFLILWMNFVFIRLYRRYLDTLYILQNNSELKDNFNKLLNTENKKLTFYYSIYPSNMFTVNDFMNSFYELFYKNSFIAKLSINDNILLSNKFTINKSLLRYADNNSNNFLFQELNITNTYNYILNNNFNNILY